MSEAVTIDAIRTPVGRAGNGSLKDVRAERLAAVPLRAQVERTPGPRLRRLETMCVAGGMGQAMIVERLH